MTTPNPVNTNNNKPKLEFFKSLDTEFDFLLKLGGANYRFTDIGELLAIRDLIDESNAETGVQAYLKFAQTCEATAADCLSRKHNISARDAYLRASCYYSAATGFLDSTPHPERFADIWKSHRKCWDEAMKLMDFEYSYFDIPYEGKTLPGYFIKRKGDNTKRPLYIFNNGSDGSIMDVLSYGGSAALQRGYNIMTFDGPGQNSSLFVNNLYFRYDWEKVITPVIDSIINRPDVDEDNLVLYGISQAGYWAPRAAAFEKRIKVLIADPGCVDVSTSWLQFLPKEMLELLDGGQKDIFNKYMGEMSGDPKAAATFSFRARPYGINDPFDLFTEVKKYNLYDCADKIECHSIITDPENEQFWPGQSQKLYDLLKCTKELIKFTAAEGGNYHCEPKARMLWEQRVFDKLDEVIFK